MIAFTAPHHAASQVGQAVLQQGGSAIEAMVAAAASIAVVYPHMNGLGGDGFWLISEPGKAPVAIDACGSAGQGATLSAYADYDAIPSRGGLAALTMAGAVAGWQQALSLSYQWQKGIPLAELLAPAVAQARAGIEVTHSLQAASEKTFADLHQLQGFDQFLASGNTLKQGQTLNLVTLADTLEQLGQQGLSDFYHGDIAAALAADLASAGSLITPQDFGQYQAKWVEPLSVQTSQATLYNLPAPTQGIASLIILALFDRVQHLAQSEADFVHLLLECTKQAFLVRNAELTDPSRLQSDLQSFLTEDALSRMVADIDLEHALPWPHVAKQGDTIWMGACDAQGRMVSYIQSLYWEFGSGVVSPQTGIVWNNRGTSFSLESEHLQSLQPGLKPFHTLNPAFAEFADGRRLSYGTMGGEGQPQTQATLFARHVYQQLPLAQSIAEGRWLLGRTWGDQSHNVKIEADIAARVSDNLVARGHDIAIVEACNELMGHAGAIMRQPSGELEAATDPRSDGAALTNMDTADSRNGASL